MKKRRILYLVLLLSVCFAFFVFLPQRQNKTAMIQNNTPNFSKLASAVSPVDLPEGVSLYEIPIDLSEIDLKDARPEFNGFYLAFDVGSSRVLYDIYGNQVMEDITTEISLSRFGDRSIYKTEKYDGSTSQVVYYDHGTAINEDASYYRGNEFYHGAALVQPDETPSYQVINQRNEIISSFTLKKELPWLPKILSGSYCLLEHQGANVLLLNYMTGETVLLPYEQFYGFADNKALTMDSEQRYQYIDSTLSPMGEPIHADFILDSELQSRCSLSGYYLFYDPSASMALRKIGVLDQELQIMVPPKENFLYLNSQGKALLVGRPSMLYSLDIFSGTQTTIWIGDANPAFLNYNDSFIMRHGHGADPLLNQLYDFDGNVLSPECETILMEQNGVSAVYVFQGKLYLIRQED